ncbi:MAG TPA: aminotransferase class V-fold PLP-dependent enzyme [Flavobacteriaceae bacterium]|nr:aminotransferase class V-fold PLP-dependent enzyme [Flavobacteriaceae bacterium]MCB9213389.1 aminotransferase class V-fold PLP-dependent enzyme [Alteromonas sp.]HPF10281.1 aminotransferase class V-fold PLP-dependent enzyme [Flavobacteriaceae bacterium]HQU20727.1 aminotransferase class V-fold PLP-dependent enzyme [Flavobacteriaceae bacterium]HQU64855.1 aminotransferase class V-fold PLP-dependent enzyme [Flavobacteriaceae bacterium]
MQHTLALFQQIVTQLLKDEQDRPVANFIPSNNLFETLDLSLQEKPALEENFVKSLSELVLTSPRTATQAFFNQLFGGRNEKAILGDLLAVILNNSMYTYKAAGPQVGVEKAVLEKVCELMGWGRESAGTIAPGGSMTNFMAMLMARDSKDASVRKTGVSRKMTVYTSTESHYSIPKNAAFSGIGRSQVRYIPVDERGRMVSIELENRILKDLAEGYLPTLINATAGTTVLGAFDAIPELVALGKKYGVWVHVDGAYCGAVLFSKKYKPLVKGVEAVDSFSFNAHKMIGTPLTCSLLLVKDKNKLFHSFANEADYLYQTDEDEFNPGKTSLQCGRRNDALKFWTLWKSVGTEGLEQIVDKQFELAEVARSYIENHPDYILYSFKDSISVCFNYKGIPARELCTQLYEKSKLLVGYGAFGNNEFIRLVTINVQNEPEDILNFFKVIETFVAENELLLAAKTE